MRKSAGFGSSGENTPVERVLMSPQGTWVAVLNQSCHLRIQNPASGQVEAIPTDDDEPDFRVYNLAVAPDGTWLAADCGRSIRVWDTTRWTLTKKFPTGNVIGDASRLFVSADGRRLFTADVVAVRAWDPDSGNPLTCMASRLADPEALTFSRDGSWLAAGDYNGLIWVWDTESGNLRATMGGGARYYQLRALAATSENTLLACPSGTTGDIVTWDVQRAEIVATSAFRSSDWTSEVAISADGQSLITSEGDTVTYYDLASSQKEVLQGDGHARGGNDVAVAFSGDGRWFAIDNGDVTEVRERSTRRVHAQVDRRPAGQRYGSPSALALNFSGNRLASASGDSIVIWDTATSQVVRELTLLNGDIRAVALSPNGRRVGVASGDQVTILDVTSRRERGLPGNLGDIRTVAFSPAGRYVAIAGTEGVRLWDAGSGHPVAVLEEHEHVTWLLFGPREDWLAVGGYHAIEIFSVPQAERLKVLSFPLAGIEGIADMVTVPYSTCIVARDTAGNLLSVDLDSGRIAALPDVTPGAVDVMKISPDGRWLGTGGEDLSVRGLPGGSLVSTYRMSGRVKSLDWSPASDGIVVGGDGGVHYLRFQYGSE